MKILDHPPGIMYEGCMHRMNGVMILRETSPDGAVRFSSIIMINNPVLRVQAQVEIEFDTATCIDEAFALFPEAQRFASEHVESEFRKAMLSGAFNNLKPPGRS